MGGFLRLLDGASAIGAVAVRRLGRTASHGCVRLGPRAAATFYKIVERERAVIRIHGERRDAGPRVTARRRHPEAFAYAPHKRPKALREWLLSPSGGR